MADNPLAGISIPSLQDVVGRAVDMMGIGTLDLANPVQRRCFIGHLEACLNVAIGGELERAIQASTERAIAHVFKVMRDADYQEKKRKRLEARRKEQSEKRKKKADAEREARMDYSRRKLEVSKTTVQ